MILANFSLSFFTSIPGMLITGGVLLLIIALIIFIATGSRKEKKKEVKSSIDGKEEPIVASTPAVDVAVTPAEAVAQISEVNKDAVVVPQGEVKVDTPLVVNQPVIEPTVSSGPNEDAVNVQPINSLGEVEPVIVNNVEPVKNETISDNSVSAVDTSNSTKQEVPLDSTASVVNQAPVVTIVDEDATNVAMPSVEPVKPIYGGTSPVIPNIEVDSNSHRPIYGGANPLENTQSIPISKVDSIPTPVSNNVEVPFTSEVVEDNNVNIIQEDPVAPKIESVAVENVPVQKKEEIESLF